MACLRNQFDSNMTVRLLVSFAELRRTCVVGSLFVAIAASSAPVDVSKLPPAASQNVDFAKDIKPILETSCLKCHGAEKPKGDLRLDTRENALKGGVNGAVFTPGDSTNSPLIHLVARLVEDSEMPPAGKGEPLTAQQVGLLRAWIDHGAPWPNGVVLKAVGVAATPGATADKVSAAAIATLPPAAVKKIDFVHDIQPIFTENCVSCHGPKRQEAEFRLDVNEIAFKGGELGPAIIPGKSAESLLIHAVAGIKSDLVMPKKGERLKPEQIGLLRAWIDQGADWPESASVKLVDKRNHWAFKPPVRPTVPSVKNKKWVRNPIDDFVLARLEKEKLKPSPEADRVTLMRRVTLDLTGLPPTVKEVDDYLADKRPDAYERLVDRLLASPHYGEKWARHWLDLARYADTNGYEKDRPRSIWPYRDWVINALNRDLSYDEFVIEQLAGDLLPNATRDQKIATGFLRNSMLNQEGGIEPEQFRVEALIDRMDTLGKSMLGLTVNCCQCHNHKYDPFAQKEYYQLYAFLNNDDEAYLEVPKPEDEKKRKEITKKVRELEAKAMKEATNLSAAMAAWEKDVADVPNDWQVLDPSEWHNFATKFEKQPDKSLLGGGDVQPGAFLKVWVDTELTNMSAFRLEALTNPNLVYNGPGLGDRGEFLLREFTVEAYAIHNPTVTNKIKFVRAVASAEIPGFEITNAIDGNVEKGGWSPSITPDHRNRNHEAIFQCAEPFGFEGGTRLLIQLQQKYEKEKDGEGDKDLKQKNVALGCFRLSVTTNTAPIKADPLTAAQRKLLAVKAEKRTAKQKADLFSIYRLSGTNYLTLNTNIATAYQDWPYPPTTLVLQQRAEPRETHIFKRGDMLRPGDEVHPEGLSVLNPFPADAPRNRLGMAKWIVDPKAPTTARVAVNRAWMNFFGQGLVTTPEDFGTRVEAPSHPELLDWLACEFMEKGWGVKSLHRLIVTSATYRQSSKVAPDLYAKDQFNRLLARSPRLRVDGEGVQDIALSTSGLLNLKIGGPSVRPPIPGSVGDGVYGGFNWPESKGEDRYRRGLYTFWKRSLPFPSLAAFDAPSGETSCPRRMRSNTPLQALTTLNEKTFVEAAQAMGLRLMKDGGKDDRSKVIYGFRLVTGRTPTSDEVRKLVQFWNEQYQYFEDRTSDAVAVAIADPSKLPKDVNLHKVAAWAMVSRTLLNLDETVTRE